MNHDPLESGFIWVLSGRRDEAESLANAAISENRGNGLAWHLKGLCAFGDGRLDAALAALDEAVELGARSPRLLLHRSWIMRRAERSEEVEACLEEALALYPSDVDLLFAAAVQRHGAGDCEAALPLYRQILTLSPERADVVCNLGIALLDLGRAVEAEAVLRPFAVGMARPATGRLLATALHLQGRSDEALTEIDLCIAEAPYVSALHHDRAVLLIELKRPEEAVSAAETALESGGDDLSRAEWRTTLGNALRDSGRIDLAAAAYRAAIAEDDSHAVAHFNLGTTLLEAGQPAEAEEHLRLALRMLPDIAAAHNNLGRALRDQGKLAEAEDCFRAGMACVPVDAAPAYNLALLLLTQGRDAEGQALYERRWEMPGVPPHGRDAPQWDGRVDPELTLLIHAEQGFGDTLQSLRFVRAAAARVGRVLLDVQPALVSLARSIPGVAQVTARGEAVEPYDAQIPTMSLPLALGGAEPGLAPPYLSVDPDLVESWRSRLPRAKPGRRRIGLVWAGNQANREGAHRSLSLNELAPLAALGTIDWVSLQVGFRSAELAASPFADKAVDLSQSLEDFADTAACLANLDGLVTIDTAVAHLAGALNRPAWVLLPFVADWRWGVNETRSARYPSLRLFSQSVSGQWEAAVARLALAVAG
jgi:tetratricopeptide (TPR) repeat protein